MSLDLVTRKIIQKCRTEQKALPGAVIIEAKVLDQTLVEDTLRAEAQKALGLEDDWQFLYAMATATTTATSIYELTGNSDQCGQIEGILLNDQLCDFRDKWLFEITKAQGAIALKRPIWTKNSETNGHPTVEFYPEIKTSGLEILYRYKRIVDLTEAYALMPPELEDYVEHLVTAYYYPTNSGKKLELDLAQKALDTAHKKHLPVVTDTSQEHNSDELQSQINFLNSQHLDGSGFDYLVLGAD